MKVSFEGIGQWTATFACGSEVAEEQVVKVSGNGEVSPCAAGDKFCGVTIVTARDGGACAVALGGMVRAAYSGESPAIGWNGLSADGNGGVKVDTAGREYLVVDVDPAGKMITFAL